LVNITVKEVAVEGPRKELQKLRCYPKQKAKIIFDNFGIYARGIR
jgi:hypothetical protein